MATETVPQGRNPSPSQSAEAVRLARLNLIDGLTMKAAYLDTALAMIYGDGFEPFDALNSDHKENYFGMCSGLASEVRGLVNQLALLPHQ